MNYSTQELTRTFSGWEQYHHLWRMEKESSIKEFIGSSPTLTEYDAKLQSYVNLEKQIKKEPEMYRVAAMSIKTGKG